MPLLRDPQEGAPRRAAPGGRKRRLHRFCSLLRALAVRSPHLFPAAPGSAGRVPSGGRKGARRNPEMGDDEIRQSVPLFVSLHDAALPYVGEGSVSLYQFIYRVVSSASL